MGSERTQDPLAPRNGRPICDRNARRAELASSAWLWVANGTFWRPAMCHVVVQQRRRDWGVRSRGHREANEGGFGVAWHDLAALLMMV